MNNSKYIKYIGTWLLGMLLFMAACTDNFDALNTPDDQVIAGNLDASSLGKAFAQSQFRGLFGGGGGGGGPFQLGHSLFSDINAQYFATTHPNFDSDQFVEIGRWTNGVWNAFYGAAAPQLYFVEQFSAENDMEVENALAKVWRVELYHRMTDFWGPIIYSEFGNGETRVPYDSQEFIYKDFFKTLDETVAVLKANAGGAAFGSGVDDQIYGGNVDQWLLFANSLRLRLAMRVRYVEPALAKTEAEKAVTDGVIEDNADNAMVLTTENSRHPYTVITNWGEYRMSSAMESVLDGYEDPRLGIYYSPAVDGDSDSDGNPYEGMRNGLTKTRKSVGDLNDAFSDQGVDWLNDARGGSNPPMRVMSSAEVYFLRAEGALLGWAMGGTAQELYEDGIRMSLSEERIGASPAEIDAYIASASTPIPPDDEWSTPALSDIPVAFDIGGSLERKLEQIITQKWLALYPDSWEAWAEYRRTGYPRLYPRINSLNPNIPVDEDFQRITFVTGEYTTNKEATEAAAEEFFGSVDNDRNDTKLWWDAKP